MFSDLEEKLKYEYERFKIDTIKHTQEQVFTLSREIEIKKMVKNILPKLDITEEEKQDLYLETDLLSSIYFFMEDTENVNEVEIEKAVQKLLKSR